MLRTAMATQPSISPACRPTWPGSFMPPNPKKGGGATDVNAMPVRGRQSYGASSPGVLMTTSQEQFSAALAALSNAVTGLAAPLQSVASTAKAAIPKSQEGIAPGDVVVLDAQGRLPAVDGSQLTNLPLPHGVSPVLAIELGHSAQANGGRGIDMGNWYQLDFRIGVSTHNDFQYTANSDGTITIPPACIWSAAAPRSSRQPRIRINCRPR